MAACTRTSSTCLRCCAWRKQNKVERVFVHCFLDGRDTPPHSGMDYLRQLQQQMRETGVGRIASLTGRYYAMDRDNRWERVERAYRAVVHGESELRATDPIEAVRRSYESGVTDEFADSGRDHRRHRRHGPSTGCASATKTP